MGFKRLKAYLDKIKMGKPISYPKFWSYLESLKLPVNFKPIIIDAKKRKGDNYFV